MSLANAILNNRPDLVTQYLSMGAPVNEMDEYGYTPLIETAIVNEIDLTRMLIEQGANVNGQDMAFGTALHWAVENSNLEMAELLLKNGANPNAYTTASESCLVKPLLRRHIALKNLLVQHGGQVNFAKDFINTKLLGHRFDLVGAVDIVDTEGRFTEVDLEGFFLEFSLDVILNSLSDFRANYAAKHLGHFFDVIYDLLNALSVSVELIRYQQYQVNIQEHTSHLKSLLQDDLQIIPVGYEGHAITLVRFRDMLTICNRRKVNQFSDQLSVCKMHNPDAFNFDLIKRCVYTKSSCTFIETQLPKLLKLEPITRLMIKRQISGNCSWANVEAAIPVTFFYLLHDWTTKPSAVIDRKHEALRVYRQWEEWDKDRALQFCLQDFKTVSPAHQASRASLLAAILFQRCSVVYKKDVARAKRILEALQTPGLEYVLDNYIQVYQNHKRTDAGKNLTRLMAVSEDPFA